MPKTFQLVFEQLSFHLIDNKSFSHAGISNTWCQAQYLFQTLPIIKIVLLGLLIALENKSMQEMK